MTAISDSPALAQVAAMKAKQTTDTKAAEALLQAIEGMIATGGYAAAPAPPAATQTEQPAPDVSESSTTTTGCATTTTTVRVERA
jgi:hypothetical protein